MQAASCAFVVAELHSGPRSGRGPVHWALMAACTLVAALASLSAVAASVTAPAAGRQFVGGANAPLARLFSQAVMALCFFLTYFSTALPMATEQGGRAALASGAQSTTRVSATTTTRFDMNGPPLCQPRATGREGPPHPEARRQEKIPLDRVSAELGGIQARDRTVARPPSIPSTCPVTHACAGSSSQAIAEATSSGSPTRPRGCRAETACRLASLPVST